MKKYTLNAAIAISTLLFSSVSFSQQPPGVGAADVDSGRCYADVIMGPPGTFTPILPGGFGVMSVELGEAKAVVSNSATGIRSFTCHGRTKPGELVEGIDFFGFPAEGTPAGTYDACVALELAGFQGACRGNNNGAVILNAEFQGNSCYWGEHETLDWTSVRSPSGKTMMSCHFRD